MATAHFKGFAPEAFAFFEALHANNDREWFLAHKADYERTLKAPMMDLVADLSSALAAREAPLFGDPKRALFRVNRDIRFSKDKSPYRTNISAVLSRDGAKRSQGLIYLHVGPGESFAAAGFYALEPADLARIRQSIVTRQKAWRKAIAALSAAGLTLSPQGAATRLPKGFDAETVGDLADTLKLKGFIVSLPLTRADLGDVALVERLAAFGEHVLPLLEFGWRALQDAAAD